MLEGLWVAVAVFCLTEMCAPVLVVWSAALDGKLIPVVSVEDDSVHGTNSKSEANPWAPLGERKNGSRELGVFHTACCFSYVLVSSHENPMTGWSPGSRYSWWSE